LHHFNKKAFAFFLQKLDFDIFIYLMYFAILFATLNEKAFTNFFVKA